MSCMMTASHSHQPAKHSRRRSWLAERRVTLHIRLGVNSRVARPLVQANERPSHRLQWDV